MRHVIFGIYYVALQTFATVRFWREHQRRVRAGGPGYSRWSLAFAAVATPLGFVLALSLLFDFDVWPF